MRVRRLTLRREVLTDLSPDELSQLAAGGWYVTMPVTYCVPALVSDRLDCATRLQQGCLSTATCTC